MRSTEQVVSRARWWIGVRTFLRVVVLSLSFAAIGLVVARVFERVAPVEIPWGIAWGIAAGAALVVALAFTVARRASAIEAARELDEAADLKQALGTALCVAGESSEWSRASVAYAQQVSRRIVVRQALPLRAPRWWWAPPACVLLFLGLGLTPRANWFGGESAGAKGAALPVVIETAKSEVKSITSKAEEALAKVGISEPDNDALGIEAGLKTPEQLEVQAVKKLTSAQDRLNELKNSEQSRSFERLAEKLEQLRSPGDGPLDEFAKALQQGDLSRATKELSELQQKLGDGSMTAEQKETLNQQLNSLAKQLEQLAEQRKDLESKLARMGFEGSLASDPEALKHALEKVESLSAEQKESLLSQAREAARAAEACKDLASSCRNAGDAAIDEMEKLAAMGQLGEQLSKLEMMQIDLAGLNAAQKELNLALGKLSERCTSGSGLAGMPGQSSSGQGSSGRGMGGDRETAAEAGFNTEKVRAKSKNQSGPVIGTTLIEGQSPTGEATAEFRAALAAGEAAAAEAIENNEVPPELRTAVREYFGKLKATKKKGPSEPQPSEKDAAPSSK